MRNYVILNGQKSTEIQGLLIQSLPPISKPLLRVETEEIDGRNGDIVTPLGYSAYDKTITIGLHGNYDVDEVIAYFNGSGIATFSNEPDKYYKYEIIQQIDYNKLIRFKTADVIFHVQPFKYSLAETERTFNFAVESGKGTSVILKTTGTKLTDIQICGNSQQSGTPKVSNPVPVKVVTGNNNVVFSGDIECLYNLGYLEVASIKYGDELYQDRIYKSGDKWYIRKEVGKYDIVTDNLSATLSYSNIAYASIPKPTDSKGYNSKDVVPCLCTHASYSTKFSTWNTADAEDLIFSEAVNTRYYLGFAAGTTLEQMKTALSGAIIYYPLATPTVTEITNSTLKSQLNALFNVDTLNGNTVIKATQYTRAQPIYYVSVKNQTLVIQNIGNYISKPRITIYGSGGIVMNHNGIPVFNIALGTEENITIDTAEMEAYKGTVLKNRLVAGDYDNFALKVGGNTISFTGNVDKVLFENYSRWL